MSILFASAHQKLAWGRKHVAELEREIGIFLKVSPGKIVTEPHPNKPDQAIHKLRLEHALPCQLSMIAGDAVDNIRASLDHAMFAVATAAFPGKSIDSAYFPFAGSALSLENALKGRTNIPREILPLLRGLKPYKGGNDILAALNLACNRNKHALILSLAAVPITLHGKVRGTGGPISITLEKFKGPWVWDSGKNEMEFFITRHDAQFDAEFDFRFLVTLAEIVPDEQAFTALYAIAGEVERILVAIEAESRRIGIVA